MKLYAISDLHVGHEANRVLLETMPDHRDDWLILGGDLGESVAHLEYTLDLLERRFARLLWVPGNHELWTREPGGAVGEAKYRELVTVCRRRGVLTPEDRYATWTGDGPRCTLVPMFLLYDYSF